MAKSLKINKGGKSPSQKRKRCPKGTRKNKKKSLPVSKPKTTSPVAVSKPVNRKRCPKGTRKNNKTGECEPAKKTKKW